MGIKSFEEYWGDKGEKWNGKLDIKEFSREVWSYSDEEMNNLKTLLTGVYKMYSGRLDDFSCVLKKGEAQLIYDIYEKIKD